MRHLSLLLLSLTRGTFRLCERHHSLAFGQLNEKGCGRRLGRGLGVSLSGSPSIGGGGRREAAGAAARGGGGGRREAAGAAGTTTTNDDDNDGDDNDDPIQSKRALEVPTSRKK